MQGFDLSVLITDIVAIEKKVFCEHLLDETQKIIEQGSYDARSFIAIITLLNQEIEKTKR